MIRGLIRRLNRPLHEKTATTYLVLVSEYLKMDRLSEKKTPDTPPLGCCFLCLLCAGKYQPKLRCGGMSLSTHQLTRWRET